MKVIDVDITRIVVGPGHRKTSKAKVSRLADSILQIGLQHPIGLSPFDDNYHLIHGRHRMEAYRELGRLKIPAVILELDELRMELAEIDENLLRSNLTELEESKSLARRKEIWEAMFPETKKGGDRGNQHTGGKTTICRSASFTEDTSAKTGQSRRTIERKVCIGKKISTEVADKIADKPIADNQAELKRLAKLPIEEQEAIAEAIANDEIETVGEYFGEEPEPYHGFTQQDANDAYKECKVAAKLAIEEPSRKTLIAYTESILELIFKTENRTVLQAKMENLIHSI